jgi:hypothetical protein
MAFVFSLRKKPSQREAGIKHRSTFLKQNKKIIRVE